MTIRYPLPGILLAIALAGCSTTNQPAPVVERGSTPARTAPAPVRQEPATPETNARPQVYTVKQGDTLYSIALNHGLDYHDIAERNGITDPDTLQVGQELRLPQPGEVVVGKSVPAQRPEEVKLPAAGVKPDEAVPVEVQPLVIKLPYSESAAAEIEKMQTLPAAAQKTPPKSTEALPAASAATPAPVPAPAASTPVPTPAPADNDKINWGMPTEGKLISSFSKSDGRMGIDIAGKMGQAIVASAAGKVVYVGNGLRGFGNLVIIKHSNTWLSAYAHNSAILVNEGDTISKGQKIAEMGDTDADRVKLHFEIRENGTPVDPAKYLPK